MFQWDDFASLGCLRVECGLKSSDSKTEPPVQWFQLRAFFFNQMSYLLPHLLGNIILKNGSRWGWKEHSGRLFNSGLSLCFPLHCSTAFPSLGRHILLGALELKEDMLCEMITSTCQLAQGSHAVHIYLCPCHLTTLRFRIWLVFVKELGRRFFFSVGCSPTTVPIWLFNPNRLQLSSCKSGSIWLLYTK